MNFETLLDFQKKSIEAASSILDVRKFVEELISQGEEFTLNGTPAVIVYSNVLLSVLSGGAVVVTTGAMAPYYNTKGLFEKVVIIISDIETGFSNFILEHEMAHFKYDDLAILTQEEALARPKETELTLDIEQELRANFNAFYSLKERGLEEEAVRFMEHLKVVTTHVDEDNRAMYDLIQSRIRQLEVLTG